MHRPQRVALVLLLCLVTACEAASLEVKTRDEICAAIGVSAQLIVVKASLSFCSPCPADIDHDVVITGNPGVVLDLCSAGQPVLNVRVGSLVIRSISVANFTSSRLASDIVPVPQIVSSAGAVLYDEVVFLDSSRPGALLQFPYWSGTAEPLLLPPHKYSIRDWRTVSVRKYNQAIRAWRVRHWQAAGGAGLHKVTNSLLVSAPQSCYQSGSALIWDITSLFASLSHQATRSITFIQEFELDAEQCSLLKRAVGSKHISIRSCSEAPSRIVQQLSRCLGDRAAVDSAQLQSELQTTRKSLLEQLTQEQQKPARSGIHSVSLRGVTAVLRQLKHIVPQATGNPAASDEPERTRDAPTTTADSTWLAPNRAALMSAKYPKGSCFADVGGYSFAASSAAEFKRLISDNAVTHMELKGDIVLTPDLFPPEQANDRTKGLNISHHVEIRACTGDVNTPVIVDVNYLQQQIYVYGFMRWAGNIKFINSYPSPRRAGLFPLISILSVEEDGIVEFEDLEIEGTETCALFEPSNAWWSAYSNDTLSKLFVPQPSDYDRLSANEVLLLNWKFNKSAWVRATQGPNGVSLANGEGYWHWIDVMADYAAPKKTAQSILVIVLPVVLGGLALIGMLVGVVMWKRRRQPNPCAPKSVAHRSRSSKDVSMADRTNSADRTYSTDEGNNSTEVISAQGQLSMLGSTASKPSVDTQELIEEARRRMQGTGTARKDTTIVLEGLLGEGTFGKVYKGHWQGTVVAVKAMLFPAAMSGKEKREKMAIMETAISSSLSHPNIVQTYTYVVKPLTGELAMQVLEHKKGSQSAGESEASSAVGSDTAESHGWEVRLVLELCDRGSLKDLLNNGGLRSPATGQPDMVGIVATALDIARAMLHLHSENVIHSDLKARNVLLKSAGSDARGFVAKVSDFGLSVRMDPSETHVSNVYQGTLTHMAPEVLMYGKISRASDVYAFGILLWELYTGQQAFKGTPRVLLGHEITKMGRRPEFPADCPFDYQLLACRCWESDPAIRPSFQQILADLQRMAAKFTMDSATSLPLPQQPAGHMASPPGATAANHQQQRQQQMTPTLAAGVAAASPAAGGLDPAKLHNWEPQTSLLNLTSISSKEGSAARLAEEPQQHEQGDISPGGCSQGLPSSLSWGTQSGGGFWLGGSLAPSNVPSDVHLPLQPLVPDWSADPNTSFGVGGVEQYAGADSMPFGHEGVARANGVAGNGSTNIAALQRQHQHQHHLSPDIHMVEDLQPLQRHHYQQMQHMMQHIHHQQQQHADNIQQQPVPSQQQQQQLLPCRGMEPHSFSSSGVCLNEHSSSMDAAAYGREVAGQQQEGGSSVGVCSPGMAPIAEEQEQEQSQPQQQRWQGTEQAQSQQMH